VNKPLFDFSTVPHYWLKDSPEETYLFNAPSLILPAVEGMVNAAALRALPHITDEKLKHLCEQFIQEERAHAKQHAQYNQHFLKQYGFIKKIIARFKVRLKQTRVTCSSSSLLALAVGCECFAGIISHTVLSRHVLEKGHPVMKAFWTWHMTEELQHRAVLMDVYRHLGGGYIRRICCLTVVILVYLNYGAKIYFGLLKKDNIPFWRGLQAAWGHQSFFRKSVIATLKCYGLSYHPRQL
jgi:predicted metal-dependent hydrolase